MNRNWLAAAAILVGGCASNPPLETVSQLDLERFMGDWYVIASIPTPFEDDAYNAVESYDHVGDGVIETTFTFNEGGFDGEQKVYRPTGFVQPGTGNAVWKMQFIWPFKADYRVIFLSNDYSRTIVGRKQRDYVWLMAREPAVGAAEYQEMLRQTAAAGYDPDKLREVPQQWN